MRKTIFTLTLCLCFTASINAQDTLRVLFLGNSYTASNNLPSLCQQFAEAEGNVLITDSNTPGGQTLISHSTNSTSLQKISQGNWDYVVLQDQSQVPTIDYLRYNWMYPGVESLHNDITSQNLCAKTVMYMTWGRQYGGIQCTTNGEYCSVDFVDFSHMTDTLASAYNEIAQIVGAQVAPVGKAWDQALTNSTTDPALVLHSGDQSHSNYSGSYLAASVFHGVFWNQSPVGNSFYGNLDESTATHLQESAQITLNEYSFSNSQIVNECVLTSQDNFLTCSIIGDYTYTWIDSVSQVIEGANGNTFTPTESGTYSVFVSNGQECEITCSISIEIESVYELNQGWNWNDRNTLINASEDIYELKIYSILGSLISDKTISGNTISIPELPQGVFMITIEGGNQTFSDKIYR